MLEQRRNNTNLSAQWWTLRWTPRVKVRLDQMATSKLCRNLLPWRNDRGFSTTHLRLILLISLSPHLSITLRLVLLSRHLPSLPLNLLAHQLRLIRRPHIVPPPHLQPLLLTNFLASVLPIRGLIFLRLKLCFHRAQFIPLIPRPQSRTHLIRRYLSPLNQWLTTPRHSGLHFAVRSQLNSLANLYGISSNRSRRIKFAL